jgi:hypothetical protein
MQLECLDRVLAVANETTHDADASQGGFKDWQLQLCVGRQSEDDKGPANPKVVASLGTQISDLCGATTWALARMNPSNAMLTSV